MFTPWVDQLLLNNNKSQILAVFNFSNLPLGEVTNPLGFTFLRNSLAGYEENDNIFHVDTIGINKGRIVQIGNKKGLRMEPATVNIYNGPRDSGVWSASSGGGSTTTAFTGTSMEGISYNKIAYNDVLANGYGKFPTETGLTAGQKYSFSFAAKAGTTTRIQNSNYMGVQSIMYADATSSWTRFGSTFNIASGTTLSCCVCDGRNLIAQGGTETAQNRNYYTDLHQLELGSPTSFTPTSRAGEEMYRSIAGYVVDGRLTYDIDFILTVSAATAQFVSKPNMKFFYLDDFNYAEILIKPSGDPDHRKIKVVVAGQAEILPNALPDWTLNQNLVVKLQLGNGKAKAWYTVNPSFLGAPALTSLGESTNAQSDFIPGSATVDFCCKGVTNQLEGAIRQIRFYS